MDCVSPTLDIFTRLWDCTAVKSSYIRHLEDNLKSLSEKKSQLEDLNEDVKRRVETEEQQQRRKRNKVVEGWLNAVESEIKEVEGILQKGRQRLKKKCLGSCFTINCYSSYKFGKTVTEKISKVTLLRREGEVYESNCVDCVTHELPRPPVDGLATEKTVGIDSSVHEVWGCMEDQSEQIIGLYGMGGVGKTTLLKKLNNKFLKVDHHFDLVIFVAVSKEGNLGEIQEVIRKKLDISDDNWSMKREFDRAVEILIRLRKKKIVLLLDDVWERLDLSKIGVSLSDSQNGSKIVFTTRSEEICGHMEAHRKFKVACLSPEAALDLFRHKVGEDVFNSHPEIPKLAQAVVGECKGFPLSLITIARAMSSRRSPREWRYAIDELRSNPSRFTGMGDRVFPTLRFSYDSLTDDTLKTCFLYCSLFPEEHNIRKDELIDLWIGEGFLTYSSNPTFARNQGEYIIGSLKLACLLETGEYSDNFVKMHDVVRDMALWLASNENKILVQRSTDHTNKSADSWREAFRLSLWGASIESLPEAPFCPHLRTLLVRFTALETFPLRFFESMGALEVLDLSYNLDLTQLPAGIGALINLRYLNLSNTSIEELPTEIMHLKNLKILLLDGMRRLVLIPAGVIRSLLSLQVFSLFSTEVIELHCMPLNGILDELKCLGKQIREISITLGSYGALRKINKSPVLCNHIKRLTIMHDLESCSIFLLLMIHLETLNIVECSLKFLDTPYNGTSFLDLHHLSIRACPLIRDLTFIRGFPNLQFLSLINCLALSEIVQSAESSEVASAGSSEVAESHNYFSNLIVIVLDSLPSLQRLCHGTMPFPSLQTVSVTSCPNLRKLPFNSDSAKNSLASIRGSAEWWEQLEWEDEATKHVFAAKFREL